MRTRRRLKPRTCFPPRTEVTGIPTARTSLDAAVSRDVCWGKLCGFDVSVVAKEMGGGGHLFAAGWKEQPVTVKYCDWNSTKSRQKTFNSPQLLDKWLGDYSHFLYDMQCQGMFYWPGSGGIEAILCLERLGDLDA